LHNARQDPGSALLIRDCLEELVDEGKIRYYGWSTDDPNRVEQFAKSKHCTAIQYVLTVTRINTPIATLCEENNLAGIVRSPFASGTLTGKYTKDTKRSPDHMLSEVDFNTERYIKTFQALDQLKELLVEHGRTLVQGILGYIWAKNDRAIPIPGAKTVNQLTENAKSLELGPISQQLMSEIDSIFSDLQLDFSYDNFAYYKEDKEDG
ncbi:MAG: aldo/keto reductase, partial [Candidatus Hodarchaeota archaeon]